jgi:hypothetical protein
VYCLVNKGQTSVKSITLKNNNKKNCTKIQIILVEVEIGLHKILVTIDQTFCEEI